MRDQRHIIISTSQPRKSSRLTPPVPTTNDRLGPKASTNAGNPAFIPRLPLLTSIASRCSFIPPEHHRSAGCLPYTVNPVAIFWIYGIRHLNRMRNAYLCQHLTHQCRFTYLPRSSQHLHEFPGFQDALFQRIELLANIFHFAQFRCKFYSILFAILLKSR